MISYISLSRSHRMVFAYFMFTVLHISAIMTGRHLKRLFLLRCQMVRYIKSKWKFQDKDKLIQDEHEDCYERYRFILKDGREARNVYLIDGKIDADFTQDDVLLYRKESTV